MMRLLLLGGADVNRRWVTGWTPLTSACRNLNRPGFLAAVELFLDHGADVNLNAKEGWSPLHVASDRNHLEAVRLLLARDADISATNDDGHTALQVACGLGCHAVVQPLVEGGADLNWGLDGHGRRTPLDTAIHARHVEVLRVLIALGADTRFVLPEHRPGLEEMLREIEQAQKENTPQSRDKST